MVKKIGMGVVAGLVIMALFTMLSFTGTLVISEPQLASQFTVSYVKHGVPFTYQTTINNSSGNYGPEVPKSTGLRISYLCIDWLFWSIVAIALLTIADRVRRPRDHPADRRDRRSLRTRSTRP